ncbi:MAG: hypothetical protein ACREV8_11605, partial [Gammaproteobacteria bacterium]
VGPQRDFPQREVFPGVTIVPIASLIVRATEQIATRTDDAIGGLLNATFANAPEIIIAIVALKAGRGIIGPTLLAAAHSLLRNWVGDVRAAA